MQERQPARPVRGFDATASAQVGRERALRQLDRAAVLAFKVQRPAETVQRLGVLRILTKRALEAFTRASPLGAPQRGLSLLHELRRPHQWVKRPTTPCGGEDNDVELTSRQAAPKVSLLDGASASSPHPKCANWSSPRPLRGRYWCSSRGAPAAAARPCPWVTQVRGAVPRWSIAAISPVSGNRPAATSMTRS